MIRIFPLVLAAGPAFAGDRYEGLEPLRGRWHAESCQLPDVVISLTDSRNNALNVYALDERGKRGELLVSSSASVAAPGYRLVSAKIDGQGNTARAVAIEIKRKGGAASATIELKIRDHAFDWVEQGTTAAGGYSVACTFKPMK